MSQLNSKLKDLAKEFGEQAVETGMEKNDYDRVPFSSPRLNYMTFGGLPLGHIIEFSGPESSGKTTTAIDVMKNAQKKFAEESRQKGIPERQIVFFDVEGTFDYAWASKFGVDTTKIIRMKVAGQPASKVLDAMLSLIEEPEIGLIILDSIAAMPPDQIKDKSVGDKIYGGIALPLHNFCIQAKKYLTDNNSMIIFINQVRDNLNSMFGGTTTPGGRGFKHDCSLRMEFRKGKYIDDNNKELTNNAENPAGNLVNVVIVKSKIFPATRRVGYYTIKYVTGPDLLNDYVEVGLQVNVINQNGSFFNIINTVTGEVLNTEKIHGKAQLLSTLAEHKEWLDLIDATVNEKDVTELVSAELLQEANKQVAECKDE